MKPCQHKDDLVVYFEQCYHYAIQITSLFNSVKNLAAHPTLKEEGRTK